MRSNQTRQCSNLFPETKQFIKTEWPHKWVICQRKGKGCIKSTSWRGNFSKWAENFWKALKRWRQILKIRSNTCTILKYVLSQQLDFFFYWRCKWCLFVQKYCWNAGVLLLRSCVPLLGGFWGGSLPAQVKRAHLKPLHPLKNNGSLKTSMVP